MTLIYTYEFWSRFTDNIFLKAMLWQHKCINVHKKTDQERWKVRSVCVWSCHLFKAAPLDWFVMLLTGCFSFFFLSRAKPYFFLSNTHTQAQWVCLSRLALTAVPLLEWPFVKVTFCACRKLCGAVFFPPAYFCVCLHVNICLSLVSFTLLFSQVPFVLYLQFVCIDTYRIAVLQQYTVLLQHVQHNAWKVNFYSLAWSVNWPSPKILL